MIALITPGRNISLLRQALSSELPDVPVQVYPDLSDPAAVKMAVLWNHPRGILPHLTGLQLIQSLGAGVDHLLRDPEIPAHTPLCRFVDPSLSLGMQRYAAMAVLSLHKRLPEYLRLQMARQWQPLEPPVADLTIGILGLGALGADIARTVSRLGFPVYGYSRTLRSVDGVISYSEADHGLQTFLEKINTLICVLPLTPATEGILNRDLFAALGKNSFLINMGRGAHLVEEDLLQAIREGLIRAAFLDVFREEPLPAAHPFWEEPAISITPHIASMTDQQAAGKLVAANYRRLVSGQPLLHQVDRRKGY